MSIRDNIPLNFGLLGNPVNWAIVILMVALAVQAMALLFASSVAAANSED